YADNEANGVANWGTAIGHFSIGPFAASADLTVTKTGPAFAAPGTNITYTITLTNNGPSNAQSVSLTDAVPTATTFVSATQTSNMNPDVFSYSQVFGTVTG